MIDTKINFIPGLPQPFSSNPTSPILPALWMPERVDEAWLKAQLAAKKQHDTGIVLTITALLFRLTTHYNTCSV